MPIWFVVYVQKIYGAGYPYYEVLKSIPATIDDVPRLFDREVGPLQQVSPSQIGGFVNYWAVYREPENPFQQKGKEEIGRQAVLDEITHAGIQNWLEKQEARRTDA